VSAAAGGEDRRTAIITGGGTGIGAATARRVARDGLRGLAGRDAAYELATSQVPLRRPACADEVAPAIAFLAGRTPRR
jgi:NADP-dependent 3-hydroxy acid dehydrogenase YdfG